MAEVTRNNSDKEETDPVKTESVLSHNSPPLNNSTRYESANVLPTAQTHEHLPTTKYGTEFNLGKQLGFLQWSALITTPSPSLLLLASSSSTSPNHPVTSDHTLPVSMVCAPSSWCSFTKFSSLLLTGIQAAFAQHCTPTLCTIPRNIPGL